MKNRLQEKKKPGGGLTDMGALKRINKSAWAAKIRSALTDVDGNVESAAAELDVSARRLYDYIDDDASLEKAKDRLRDDEIDAKDASKKESIKILKKLIREEIYGLLKT